MTLNFKQLIHRKGFHFHLFWFFSITPFLLYFLNLETTPKSDWDYFNSLNLVIIQFFKNFQLPTIDLRTCGGIDIFANPQSSVFSPLSSLLIFGPYIANVLSIALMSYIGFLYTYKITKLYCNNAHWPPLFLASLFNLSSFFALHFAEGHIPFRSFYLIPLVYYYLVECISQKGLRFIAVTLLFSLLDGGLYFLFFTCFLSFLYLAFNYKDIRKYQVFITKQNMLFILGIISLAIPKIFILATSALKIRPSIEREVFSFTELIHSLYNINLNNHHKFFDLTYNAHEYVTYITASLTLLLVKSILKERSLKLSVPTVGFAITFWIYCGVGGVFNPWTIFKSIPILNMVHIQSRFAIYVFFFLLLIIAKSKIADKQKVIFLSFAVAELTLHTCLVYWFTWHGPVSTQATQSNNLVYNFAKEQQRYAKYISKPKIYKTEQFSYDCYEPAQATRLLNTLSLTHPANDQIILGQIGMNKILIRSDTDLPQELLVNLNFNHGWKCDHCESIQPKNGIIYLRVPPNAKSVTLIYSPVYMRIIFISLLFGGLMIFLSCHSHRWLRFISKQADKNSYLP